MTNTLSHNIRILQLGKFYPILGGVEKVMYDLTEGLAARGVECDMMCAMSEGPSRVFDIAPRARLIGCRALRKVKATMISPAMISELRRRCKDYDIIHVHHPDPMACLALRLSGYKGTVVLHWHADIEKQKKLLKLYKPLQNWLLRRADIILGTSPVYLSESAHLGAVQHKVLCLPIGIEPVNPDPNKVQALRDRYAGRKIIFTLGRLVGYKGYEHLIEAARYLTDDYVLLIGGAGPLADELAARITDLGLSGRVELLGRISDEDLPSYYGACSVFCLSSIWKTEAFGIVQIEAMSCGKVVVATKIPHSGVAWVNEHGVSGLNVEPGDARGLADAILAVTADDAAYSRYSAGASRRFAEVFTKDKMIENLIPIYERLLWKK